MASCTCSFSLLVDQCSPCGTRSDYPTHVEVVTLKDCSRDVLGHLESYGIRGDEAIHNELGLLLAPAGILVTFSIVLRCSIKLCNGLSSWFTRLAIVSSTYILMGRCNHSLSLDATIMVSKNCPII